MNKHFILKFLGKKGRIMKRFYSNNSSGSKKTAVSLTLILICVALLIAGVILLLIEPIKRYNRKKITSDAVSVIESDIATAASTTTDTNSTESSDTTEPRITYIVPAKGNEVEGEEYDFIGETEEYYQESVVLNSIGILSINKIGIRYPVWDEATLVSLRYGLGHYEDSVMPGEIGNSTIFGHNNRDGSMFQRLWEVEIGDEVVFTNLDGEDLTFYVVDTVVISAEDILDYTLGDITDERQLTLITCTYIDGESGFRRIVICQLAED